MWSTQINQLELPAWSAPERARIDDQTNPLEAAARPLGVVVSALSHALDLGTGQPIGHSVRACVLGMRMAEEIGLPEDARSDLFYALLLKDCGCTANSSKVFHAFGSDELKAKRDVKVTDWTRMSRETVAYALSHVGAGRPLLERGRLLMQMALRQKQHSWEITKIRCERGATLARLMGLSPTTAEGILSLDEHWDGRGFPDGLRGRNIPISSRIMLLAQTVEVIQAAGAVSWLDVVRNRRGTWFDPDLIKAAESLEKRGALWKQAEGDDAFATVLTLEPKPRMLEPGAHGFDGVCLAFAQIVDAKSPFTFNHSLGVANAAVAMGQQLGLPAEKIVFLRQAALLHDLGKLSVSNAILEKPGKLDAAEWAVMRLHPFYTWKVLNAIPGFGQISEVAASHHEKLDGSGYFRGLAAERLSREARILVVADIFDALSAKRPYRDSLPRERVFEILRKDIPHALDADCVAALEETDIDGNQQFVDLSVLLEKLQRAARRPV